MRCRAVLIPAMTLATVASLTSLVATAPEAHAVAPGLNGRLVMVSTPVSSTHRDILTMNPDGSDRVNLTAESQAYVTYNPEGSPDGRWIAYQHGQGGQQDSIWKMRADGSEKTRLTDGVAPDAQPTWSPDGTRIAFVRSQQIWTMDADGSNEAVFHADAAASMLQPEWSPDGATIAFVALASTVKRIWTKPVAGGSAIGLTPNVASVRGPSWSPDGTKLLFWHTADGTHGLYTVASGGGITTLLVAGVSSDFSSYAWAPEGDRIVYTSSVSGNPEAWVMDADGTDAVQITNEGTAIDHMDASWMTPSGADTTVLPNLVQGVAMAPLQLTGAVGATFSVSGGNLPAGLSLSPDGLLSGTPSAWGDNVFEVTATGTSATVRPYAVHVVDRENPAVNVTSPLPHTSASLGVTTSLQQLVKWVGTDATSGVTSYDVRYRRAPWNGAFAAHVQPAAWQRRTGTSLTHALSRGYTYCYSVRASDASGRTGGWSLERCTIAPLDQTAMQRSAGWKTKSSSAYFGGTAWATATRYAALARTGARLRRVGVLATTCPTCGVIDVYVGSTKIGRISLARGTTTVHKAALRLPAFSPRSGTVRIKVVTKGRSVRIDGLLIGAL